MSVGPVDWPCLDGSANEARDGLVERRGNSDNALLRVGLRACLRAHAGSRRSGRDATVGPDLFRLVPWHFQTALFNGVFYFAETKVKAVTAAHS